MASIFKPKGRTKYRITYIDACGKRASAPGYRDKQATEAKAKQLERDAERQRSGLRVTDQAKLNQSLDALIDAYIDDLKLQGRSHCHTRAQKWLLHKIRTACNWQTARSIHSDGLRTFLMRYQGKAPRTINYFRDGLVTFCNWCVDQGVFGENPVGHVKKAKSPGNQKFRARRAYTVDEWKALCESSRNHGLLYRIAGLSGLRRNELRLLEKRDLTPIGDNPTWHLRAEITKGRRLERVPMLPECRDLILPHWSSLSSSTQRVFPRIPRTHTLHNDLERAKVVRVNDEKKHVDFHSLRYFFCTLCAKSMSIQMVRGLMRHKNIKQTCDLYMDLGLTDMAEALAKLPRLLAVFDSNGAKITTALDDGQRKESGN